MRVKLWQIVAAFPIYGYLVYDTFSDLRRMEEEGGVVYLGRFDHALYRMGGPWGVIGGWATIGLIYVFAVWRYIADQREAERLAGVAAALDRPDEPTPVTQPPVPRPRARQVGRLRPITASPVIAAVPERRLDDIAPPDDPAAPRFLR